MKTSRQWTVYLAQDKHLDYNWCGSRVEIEVRMAALSYVLDHGVQAAVGTMHSLRSSRFGPPARPT
jgi:hypothetical protein